MIQEHRDTQDSAQGKGDIRHFFIPFEDKKESRKVGQKDNCHDSNKLISRMIPLLNAILS